MGAGGFLRVKMANDTATLPSPARARGLGTGPCIWRVAEALEYGIVGIKEGIISPRSRWRDRALRRHEGKPHRPMIAGSEELP
jgi:hypothetical protein